MSGVFEAGPPIIGESPPAGFRLDAHIAFGTGTFPMLST